MSSILVCFAVALLRLSDPAASSEAVSDFGGARWLWPDGLGCVTNTTVEFRTGFHSEKETAVTLSIAADTVYSVSLNGGQFRVGRFPNIPPSGFYDVLGLGKCRRGANNILIRLYVQGRDSFQYIPGRPGVMFRLSGDGVLVESGIGTEWRRSTADRAQGVHLVTSQLGFSFEYDATAPTDSWKGVCSSDIGLAATELSLLRRPVPPSEILPEVSERIVAQGSLDGSDVRENAAVGMDATVMTAVDDDAFFENDGRSVRERWFKDGFYVIVDLGREETGLLSLDVETDAGAVIDIGNAEHMENGRIKVALRSYFFAGRYWAAEGRNSYCRWARRIAGRYIQIHVRGVRTRFKLNRLSVKPVEFPIKEAPLPSFVTGTAADIWRTSVRTLRLCMHEHYEDCPWREQAMYANDSRNQMLAGYFAFTPENKMPEFCLQLFSRAIGDDGWLSICTPSRVGRPIPSFTFSWVLAVGDHLKYRQNVAFTKEMMPFLAKVLDRRLSELKDGLLPCPKSPRRYWQFYDWAKDLDNETLDVWSGDRFDAPLNLFCLLAFEAGGRCADRTGAVETAERWREATERMRMAIREKFWNDSRCCMETTLNDKLAPAELVQALALLANAVPAERRAEVVEKLSRPSDWTETSLSQSLYKYEALIAERGEVAQRAVSSMVADWKAMLDAGATSFWEVKEGWTAFNGLASLCHGWSAIPIYVFMRAHK